MTKSRFVAFGSVLAMALTLAPVSSAFAGGPHYGGHGGYGYGGHGGYGYGAWPLVGLAAAVIGTAAAIVTAPIAILAAAASAPYYGPVPVNAPPLAAYNAPAYGGPVAATGYYAPPAAPAYYGPPGAPAYYGPPAAPVYYAPPVTAVYPGARAAPAYYGSYRVYQAPRPVYYAQSNGYYGR